MKGRFDGRCAVVTGAASGIGRATVARLLADGAMVCATDINQAGLEKLASELEAHGQRLTTVDGDIAREPDSVAIIQRAVECFGPLHILVNSAGITARNVGPDASLGERWDAVMRVNVKGTLLMCHAAVEAMRQAGKGGAIVNLASIMGLVGYPTSLAFSDGFNPYPQSKGAIVQLTRDMGVRLAPEGIRINTVCPGFIYTPLTENVTGDAATHNTMRSLHPLGRMGEAEEVANVIAFLASDEASFVAGAIWAVDGGYTAM